MSDIDLFTRQENEVLKKEKHELQHKIIDLRQNKEKLQIKIDKAIEEINYMITNVDITEISAIKLKQILGDKE